MKNLVTFSKQANGYIQFTVKPGYYAGASMSSDDQSEIVYIPNYISVGKDADEYITIKPLESVCDSQPYTETHNACTRVDVHMARIVNAGCPKGWSVALVEHKMYGGYVSMEVKQILYTRHS